MKDILEKILADAKEADQPPGVQMIVAGQQVSGILGRNVDFPELYALQSEGAVQNQQTGEIMKGVVVWTFPAESVQALLAFQPIETSNLAVPGGKKTPGGIIV